jgi:hypothetical protein
VKFLTFFVTLCIACATNVISQTLTTTNLPIIIINTNGQQITDEPGIITDIKIINNASGINTITDSPNEHDGKAKVEYRGCSSQSFPKKSYGFELRDPANTDNDLDDDLFGFPTESDWVLNAAYTDKTLMRDALSFYMSNRTGNYASRTRYVELVIDGQYQGIYVLEEKVKRDAGRVDVKKLDPTDKSASKITGGYIVKIDKSCGNVDPGHSWTTNFASPGGNPDALYNWATHFPNDSDLTTDQFNYIKNYVQEFETVMNGDAVCESANGYNKYILDDTFIDHFLLQEMTSNSDAFRFSSFFSKQRDSEGGKLRAGPLWDMNLALGFLTSPFSGNSRSYEGWQYTAPGDPAFPVPFFWGKLLTCCDYRNKVFTRYQQLRRTVLQTSVLMAFIDSQFGLLNQGAYDRNFQKWPIIGMQTWTDQPSYTGETLVAEVNYLKTWVTNRLNWMDANIGSFVTQPPVLSASSATISTGQSSTLTASGCTGTVKWSTGSEGNKLVVVPTETTNYTATCKLGTCESNSSALEVIVKNVIVGICSDENRVELSNSLENVTYQIRVDSAGIYAVKISYVQWQNPTGAGGRIVVNEAISQEVDFASTGNPSVYGEVSCVVKLLSGTNNIRIYGGSEAPIYTQKMCVESQSGGSPGNLAVVDLGEETAGESLLVWPNPNKGEFEVSFNVAKGKDAVLSVTDLSGKVWYEQKFQGSGMESVRISLPFILKSNVFLVHLNEKNSVQNRKVLVVK